MKHVIALDVGGTGMKAALVGADGALLHEARRPTGRERGPEAVVEAILDFAAELRAHGGRAVRRGRARPPGSPCPASSTPSTASPSTPRTSAGSDVPLRELLERAARRRSRSRSATTSAPAGWPRAASARAGAPTGSCSCRWAPASRAPSASTAGSRRARTASRARSATSSCGPAGPRAAAASAAAWRRWPPPRAVGPRLGRGLRRPGRGRGRLRQGRRVRRPARPTRCGGTPSDALADGLVTALTLLDPRTLIIGGGLAEAGDTLFTPLRAAVEARVTFQQLPTIVPAALGDTAGCLGAGLLAWDLLATEVTA